MSTPVNKIRHIVDNSISLLAHSCVPFDFWDYAFAILNINSIPSRSYGVPPLKNYFPQNPFTIFFEFLGLKFFLDFVPTINPNSSIDLPFVFFRL